MWPASVVVCDLEKAPQVPLVERDQKIKSFAANRADQSLTERVRLGAWKGVFNTFRSSGQFVQAHHEESIHLRVPN